MTGARTRAAACLAVAVLAGGAAPAAASGSLITVIDNSHADSVLEVDRTANLQSGSGTAGSDHEGSAVYVLATLLDAAHLEPEED
ncbi:hypothetical protein [Streptomyces subrutilus]|uniref:Uncharacterized protein n=1 Tax=Streptomyces subrutilus TaxID=36818 RepID=A0A1E5PZH9_9ACTN|nr:hypothetical protein [Streptomyces subrutilus]OEJ35048.1 hypothetical protein BGK67_30355 [Streptomyces subrutilus]